MRKSRRRALASSAFAAISFGPRVVAILVKNQVGDLPRLSEELYLGIYGLQEELAPRFGMTAMLTPGTRSAAVRSWSV
jgi:hypothetical protein